MNKDQATIMAVLIPMVVMALFATGYYLSGVPVERSMALCVTFVIGTLTSIGVSAFTYVYFKGY